MRPPREEHFPLFDSLRGLAALAVFTYHALYHPATFAGVGEWWWRYARSLDIAVPVFFGISGFLLYRPFVAARLRDRPMPGLWRYGRRRFLRIVPGYWVALTVVGVWLGLEELRSARGIVVHYGFLQVYDPDTAIKGIGQAWTLGVEVVFYALLPLWALLMRRRPASVRTELLGLAGIAAASLAWKAFMLTQADPGSPRSLTWILSFPSWADQLAVGMALAVLSVRGGEPGWMRRPAIAWGLAAACYLAACWVAQPGLREPMTDVGHLVRYVFFAATVFFLLLPAVFGHPGHGRIRRFLGVGPVAFVGTISYSFYLLHLAVVIQVARWWGSAPASEPEWVLWYAGTLAGSLALGTLGYFAVERPFMRLGRFRRTAHAHAAP